MVDRSRHFDSYHRCSAVILVTKVATIVPAEVALNRPEDIK